MDTESASGDRGTKAPLDVIAASLRRHRARAGLSLSEVAKRAGVAKSTLSQLESGTGNPSVETLWALAVALDTPFAALLDPPRPKVQIIRAGDGPVIYSDQADYSATLVASSPPNARRDIYRIAASPARAGSPSRTCPAWSSTSSSAPAEPWSARPTTPSN